MKKFLFLLLVPALLVPCAEPAQAAPAASAPPALSQLSGKISDAAGGAVAGVYVYAYRESNTHFFGPPTHMSEPTGADGLYRMEVPPGKYYLFARKRQSGTYQGPLYKEDYFSDQQPLVEVGPGKAVCDLTVQKLEGQQFYRPEKIFNKTGTVITGRILDASGKPVLGAFAFAYKNRFRKQAPPDFGGLGSDTAGKYFLYFDQGGDFIVGARMSAKEPPVQGEMLGFYQGDREKAVSVATGSVVENVDITLRPFSGTPETKPGAIPLQK